MSAFLQDWSGWILLAVIVFLCVLILLAVIVFLCVLISILPEQR